ncbi:Cardiolipin Synthase [Klebsormidium nitens]|uniref:Cardiolipin Synthase n=1 Tax=Klebsormidium nitens TaxID=105231 RepID=A0A1Y1I2F2_KLENI|nr:Cardiolipin Synthase [Klebsormidium nitens]|eukprot:GAQ82308.1 Cardiolipin Synthase [Klebsormidium nitens]
MLARTFVWRARFLASWPREPVPLPNPSFSSAAYQFSDERVSSPLLQGSCQKSTDKNGPSSPHVSSHFDTERHSMAAAAAQALNEHSGHSGVYRHIILSSVASSLAPTLACSGVVQSQKPLFSHPQLPPVPFEQSVQQSWSSSKQSECPSEHQASWSFEHIGGATRLWASASHWTYASNLPQYKPRNPLRQVTREGLSLSQTRQISTEREDKQKQPVESASLADAPVGPTNQETEVSETVGVKEEEAVSSRQDTEKAEGWSTWTKDEAFNLPNGISMARLISGPAIGGLIVAGYHRAALGALVVAGLSDWLDGYVAKHYNHASTLGSYLDPLADKVLMGSVAVALAWQGTLPVWLVSLVVARDGALVGAAALHRARTLGWKWNGWSSYFQLGEGGAPKVRPLFISKANTVFQLALVGSALTHLAYGVPAPAGVSALCYLVGTTTILSWIGYLIVYLRNPSRLVL